MTDWNLLQNQIGIHFNDLTTLQQALVHRSFLNENLDFNLESNERLEFLGDALLGFVVADNLYEYFYGLNEGEMTKLRSALVRQDSLASLASSLNLGDYLYLGQGEEKGGGRSRPRNLACAMEALIGAIFIDQGLKVTRDFILKYFGSSFRQMIEEGLTDYKSSLQELVQARKQGRPIYYLVKTEGPDHLRVFTVEVEIEGEVFGKGCGRSKRAAEKEAARNALHKLSEG